MSPPMQRSSLSWTVVESGDRWFQAVLRFTAGSMPHDRQSIRHLSIAAASELAQEVGTDDDRLRIVLWEVPADPAVWLHLIDLIATLRRRDARRVQLAHLPTPASRAAGLAVQAAGVTVLLGELWTLEPLACRLASRVAMARGGTPRAPAMGVSGGSR